MYNTGVHFRSFNLVEGIKCWLCVKHFSKKLININLLNPKGRVLSNKLANKPRPKKFSSVLGTFIEKETNSIRAQRDEIVGLGFPRPVRTEVKPETPRASLTLFPSSGPLSWHGGMGVDTHLELLVLPSELEVCLKPNTLRRPAPYLEPQELSSSEASTHSQEDRRFKKGFLGLRM